MLTVADVPTSSQAVSSWPRSLIRRSPCTSPMISVLAGALSRRETYPSHSAGAGATGGARYTHGARENKRERERERREKERERGEDASGGDGGVGGVVVRRSGRMHQVPRRSSRHVSRSVAAVRGRRRRSRSCIPRRRFILVAAGCFSSSSELAPRVRLLLMCRALVRFELAARAVYTIYKFTLRRLPTGR